MGKHKKHEDAAEREQEELAEDIAEAVSEQEKHDKDKERKNGTG